MCPDPGTVFKITPSGTLTTLYSFFYYLTAGTLLPRLGGKGATATSMERPRSGGQYEFGNVFKITPGGTLNQTSTASPVVASNLVPGYCKAATATSTGPPLVATGTVSQNRRPAAPWTTLYTFGGSDGFNPYAGLVQGSDGNFYGTTYYGMANNVGIGLPSGRGSFRAQRAVRELAMKFVVADQEAAGGRPESFANVQTLAELA